MSAHTEITINDVLNAYYFGFNRPDFPRFPDSKPEVVAAADRIWGALAELDAAVAAAHAMPGADPPSKFERSEDA